MPVTVKKKKFLTVDEYIGSFPSSVRSLLKKIRRVITITAPAAEEIISYGIAGYKYHGMLIYFAGFKNHVSLYPAPRTDGTFKKELAAYEGGKGTVQFPIGKPLPLDLVKRIVRYRIRQNEEKSGLKKRKTKTGAALKKEIKTTDESRVNAWMDQLQPAVRKDIDVVRKLIRSASPKLGERLKWNAPSYYYSPAADAEKPLQDIVTFGPYRNQRILLVFHHPAVVKVKSPLLEGAYKDRRLVYLQDGKEALQKKKELLRIIREITGFIQKKINK